jgi:hypothetical protein
MIKKIAGIAAVLLLILGIGITISRANVRVSRVEVLDSQSLELNALNLDHLDDHYEGNLSASLNLRSELVPSGFHHLGMDNTLSNLVALHQLRRVDLDPSVDDLLLLGLHG